LSSQYNENTIRNLKKARENDLVIQYELKVKDLIEMKRRNNINKLQDSQLKTLSRLIQSALEKGRGTLIGIMSARGGLCAAAFFLIDHGRAVYLVSVANEEGKDNRAMFLLVDHFIKRNAGTKLLLDFEGSMVPGVARFFAGFGASPEIYYTLKISRLPFFW
jgi:hypothetical protein